jgi:hypothetical protein
LSSVLESGERISEWTDIHFDDTQDIQVLQDQFLQTHHHLTTNRMILQELIQISLFSAGAQTHSENFSGRSIHGLIREAEVQTLRVASILQRVDATLALVRFE